MLRSMYSGISGMKNFQTKLDVIGNNIANVSTYGYKKGRVTFKDAMNQTLAGANAANVNMGGTNPSQVGLGSTLATIDTIHEGSSMQTTGRSLDLGIEGDGYFVVNQGENLFYTRAGNFYLDENGTLVNSEGLKVQAYRFDEAGNRTNVYGDVTVNVNGVLPGVETTAIKVTDNLSANAITGSVYSQQIQVVDKSGQKQDATIYFKKQSNDQWGVFANTLPVPSTVTTTGNIKITNSETYTGDNRQNWALQYDSEGKYWLKKGAEDPIEMSLNDWTKKLEVVNSADINKLEGLEIDVSGIEKEATATVSAHGRNPDKKPSISVIDPTLYLGKENLKLTIRFDKTTEEYAVFNNGENIASIGTDDIIPISDIGLDINVRGLISQIPEKPDPSDRPSVDDPEFDAKLEEYEREVEVYNRAINYEWSIDVRAKTPIEPEDDEPAVLGEISVTPATKPAVELQFLDGKVSYINGQIPSNLTSIDFDIATGVKDDVDTVVDESKQSVAIDFDFTELTQLTGTSTALVNPNGNIEGALESFNIGSYGEVNGVYSNGEVVTLGQIALAKFSNTSGLIQAGNNLFQASINSGTPDMNVAGEGRGIISSGALEMSNVDLSEEFTEMITAQRAFQANTRIITTSDEILQELVNLKR